MRRFLVAGNWKMHGSSEMTVELISGVARRAFDAASLSEKRALGYDILVCPPAPYLAQAVHDAEGQSIMVGAQNVSQHASGAYTGEISLSMLAELGCRYVLIGHSERRQLYSENDDIVALKFAASIESQMIPILCVGETLSERQAGDTELVVSAQIDAVLGQVGIDGFDNAVIAYEPVWAIGTGETASPQQAQEVHAYIRAKLSALSVDIAAKTQILYGGSVKPANAEELFAQKDIDGGLIGGASLDVDSFAGICEVAQKLSHEAFEST